MNLLEGVTVASFNHFLAGPAGAQILGDLGADVIAVEPLDGAFHRNWAVNGTFVDGQSVNFISTGRNKRSVAFDLKSEAGQEIARRLVAKVDVVMENFRPGTMAKLGLGYDDVKVLNPRVIYASASGYGSSGPYRDKPGQDLLVQAISGLAARTGRADGPPTPSGPTVSDHHTGAFYALGVLAALIGRGRTGKGCLVEVDLLSAALDVQFESLVCWLNGGRSPSPRGAGNLAAWYSPAPYGIHATKDGHVAISMGPMKPLAEAFGLPELAAYSEKDQFDKRAEIVAKIRPEVAARPTAHWLEVFGRLGIWHAKVQDYDEVVVDAQVRHNRMIQTMPGATGVPITMVMHPVRYDGQVPEVRLVPQPLGAQTRDVLAELGYSADRVDEFEAAGVIRTHPGQPAAE